MRCRKFSRLVLKTNNGMTSKQQAASSKRYSARGILDDVEISLAGTIAKIPLQVMLLPMLIIATLYLVQKK